MKENLRAFFNQLSKGITDEEFEACAAMFTPVQVKKMDHLFKEGDNVKNIYFLHTGVLRGYYLKEGVQHTSFFHWPPHIITDIYAFREKVPSVMNVQALKDTECYEADFEAMENLVKTYPSLLTVFFKLYESIIVKSKARQLSFVYDTPKERYLKLFKEQPHIIAEIPQHYIASYLGIQPETLSRIRKKIF